MNNPTIKTNTTTEKPDTIKLVMYTETQVQDLISQGFMTEKQKQELEKNGQIKHTKYANYTEDMITMHKKVKELCYVKGSNNGIIFKDKKGVKRQCMVYYREVKNSK